MTRLLNARNRFVYVYGSMEQQLAIAKLADAFKDFQELFSDLLSFHLRFMQQLFDKSMELKHAVPVIEYG